MLDHYLPAAPAPGVDPLPTDFTYTPDGDLQSVFEPDGRGIEYVYDQTSHQLAQTFASGEADASFTYSGNGQLNTATRGATTVTITNNGPFVASETWGYSNVGLPDDAATGSVAWVYNNDFRVQTETVLPAPSSGLATATYGFDPDGLLLCASLSSCAPGAANQLTS